MEQIQLDSAKKWLLSAGLRPTRQRKILADLLTEGGQHKHVTAEILFEKAKKRGQKVSLATVYNTLRKFCKVGLLQEVTIHGAKSYFDTNTVQHAHFYYEATGKLVDTPLADLEITKLPKPPPGHQISNVNIVIWLQCQDSSK